MEEKAWHAILALPACTRLEVGEDPTPEECSILRPDPHQQYTLAERLLVFLRSRGWRGHFWIPFRPQPE